MARGRREPIPLTVIVGPRGAGKSTLVNRLLLDPAFAETAIILNDFGEVAISGAVVEASPDGIVAFGSGCICCSVRGALTDGLETLLRDVDNRRIEPVRRLVIEADEMADPAAIVAAVERHPYLSLRFIADGIVAVIDATTAEAALARRQETVRQIAMADVVLLSRLDEDDAALSQRIAALNPVARIDDASTAAAEAIVGHGPFDPSLGKGVAGGWPADVQPRPAAFQGEAARIRAFTVDRQRAIPFGALNRFLDYLPALQASRLIRVDGLVRIEEGGVAVVEGRGGFFRPLLIADIADIAASRFRVVALDLDQATFEGYLDAFLNEVRIDAPDRAALSDNPLAIPGVRAGGPLS
jgi:G3E family GTPase